MTPTLDRSIPLRTLLAFAIGALLAAAVTVMAMRSDAVTAEGESVSSSYSAITPCRLADTRPAPDRVGSKATFSTQDTHVFDVGADGDAGECDPIGNDVTAIAMNITALNATELSFLTVWPSGDLPLAASLNPAPGQPPVPNAVTTQLDGTTFSIYNDTGSVDVVIDLVGVYRATAAGPNDFEVLGETFPLDFTNVGDNFGGQVACPEGKLAIGGGASVSHNEPGRIISLESSRPSTTLEAWNGRAVAVSSDVTGNLFVYAICAKNVALAPS